MFMLTSHKKIMARLSIGLFVSVALLQAAFAEDTINPDRPGIADGSNVVGAGRFQIEAGIQQEFRRNGTLKDRRVFLPTLLRLGIGEQWEARIESNVYTWQRETDSDAGVSKSQGYAPVSLGVKYHFLDGNGPAQPSLGAILRVFPASGSNSFRTRHTTGDFRLAADWDFAPDWSLNPNLGVAVYEDGRQQLFSAGLFAMTLTYSQSKALSFFVDTGVQSPEGENGKTAITYDAGVAYLISRDVQLDFSVGAGTAGVSTPRAFLSAGISMRF